MSESIHNGNGDHQTDSFSALAKQAEELTVMLAGVHMTAAKSAVNRIRRALVEAERSANAAAVRSHLNALESQKSEMTRLKENATPALAVMYDHQIRMIEAQEAAVLVSAGVPADAVGQLLSAARVGGAGQPGVNQVGHNGRKAGRKRRRKVPA